MEAKESARVVDYPDIPVYHLQQPGQGTPPWTNLHLGRMLQGKKVCEHWFVAKPDLRGYQGFLLDPKVQFEGLATSSSLLGRDSTLGSETVAFLNSRRSDGCPQATQYTSSHHLSFFRRSIKDANSPDSRHCKVFRCQTHGGLEPCWGLCLETEICEPAKL
jgi:hypothetical protein